MAALDGRQNRRVRAMVDLHLGVVDGRRHSDGCMEIGCYYSGLHIDWTRANASAVTPWPHALVP